MPVCWQEAHGVSLSGMEEGIASAQDLDMAERELTAQGELTEADQQFDR